MHRNSLFKSAEKDLIYSHLKAISNPEITEQETKNVFKAEKSSWFIIGKELKGSNNQDNSKYFTLYFQDVRMDEVYPQVTPMVVYRKGILKIGEGTLSILDDQFNTMDVNSFFTYKQNKLELELDSALMEQKSSPCAIL